MIRSKFFDIAVVLLMVLGLVTVPGHTSAPHGALAALSAELEPPPALPDMETIDHDHHHDDEDLGGKACGELHGHDAADHSHQVAFAQPDSDSITAKAQGRWSRVFVSALKTVRPYRIDRPPQVQLSA